MRSLGIIPNRAESVSRLVRKLRRSEQLRVWYEAGPTGYALYWQLMQLGVRCEDFSDLAPIVRNAREYWRDLISRDPL